jgi:histidine triad (HIT) family protein
MRVENCLFCRIVAGSIPATIVYRDDHVTAFQDIQPQAPVHVLIVPNGHVAGTNELTSEHDAVIGHLMRITHVIAQEQGIAEGGYRLVVNTGKDAQQSVAHLHVHLIGGRPMSWPPG